MSTRSEEYNGWSNYETWLVKLWIDNEQGEQSHWLEMASEAIEHARGDEFTSAEKRAAWDLEDVLKEQFADSNPLASEANVWSDLMRAAFSRVAWGEIAAALIEDAKEIAS